MKYLVFIFVFTIFSLSSIAQSNEFDSRLLVKYSAEELNSLKIEKLSEFKFLNYCLDNAWYLSPLPEEKMKSSDGRIGKISIENINKINIYALGIKIIQDDYQFFAIEGTNKMLVIKSKDHILKEIK